MNRALMLAACSAALLLIALCRPAVHSRPHDDRETEAARARQGRPLLFGINPALARWYDEAGKDHDWENQMFDRIAEACGTVLRTGFDWAQIEPDPPNPDRHYRWSDFDHIVDEAEARGLRVVALIVTSPPWANEEGSEGAVHLWPPNDEHRDDYVAFLTALVDRYRGRIAHYEFWNEANACGWRPGCGGSRREKAADYLRWLKLTHDAIKWVDPGARVSTSGLDLTDPDVLDYVERLYDYSTPRRFCEARPCRLDDLGDEGYPLAGGVICQGWAFGPAQARPCWDAIAVHPYNEDGAIDFERLDAVRRIMVAHGDGQKPIWITEYGWSSIELHPQYLEETLATLSAPAYSYVELASYVVIADAPQARGLGLVDSQLRPKRAYHTFAEAACGDSSAPVSLTGVTRWAGIVHRLKPAGSGYPTPFVGTRRVGPAEAGGVHGQRTAATVRSPPIRPPPCHSCH